MQLKRTQTTNEGSKKVDRTKYNSALMRAGVCVYECVRGEYDRCNKESHDVFEQKNQKKKGFSKLCAA